MPRVVPSQIVIFIDQALPIARDQEDSKDKRFPITRNHSTLCTGIMDLIEQLPAELLVLSPERYTELVAAVAAIREAIEKWRLRDEELRIIPGLGNLNPISLIRRALSECPDEFPSKKTKKLDFISEEPLRKILEIDIGAINRALSNGEWKSATVLAGSVIEALLLWELINNHEKEKIKETIKILLEQKILDRNPGSDLEKWNLNSYIEVATALEIITNNTAQQAKLAKQFRNLIHPGREKRLRQKCDRGTALSAVAAVEHVVRDLIEKTKPVI